MILEKAASLGNKKHPVFCKLGLDYEEFLGKVTRLKSHEEKEEHTFYFLLPDKLSFPANYFQKTFIVRL